MTDMNNINIIIAILTAVVFAINVTVEMTKEFIPVPTKLWTIIVSVIYTALSMISAISFGIISGSAGNICLLIPFSSVAAYVAMYGYDTAKELWDRLRKGDDSNE